MKKLIIFTLLSLFFAVNAQEIPEVTILNSQAESFDTKYFNESHDKPIIISFWATWCVSCINELTAINDNYVDWKEEADFEVYAISTDNMRAAKKALALANGKGWEFDILLDTNQELKRALNIVNIPYLIVIKNGEIIHTKLSYTPGSEDELFEVIKENQ